jgi:hypothetical protein
MARIIKRELIVESHPITGLICYEVSLEDLNQLEKETLAVGEDFSFGLFCLATAISFTIALITVEIPAGKTYETFAIITILGYAGTIFFGFRWFKTKTSFKNTIRRIKERPGPLGEEGNEIGAEALDNLSSAESDKL